LVEQRRDLILDPDNAPKRVETALTGLAVAPELFNTPANVYLGLKQANSSLQNAHSDADLIDVAALLWAMAQQIEDGDASQAERDLRAAEQALREALQERNGAQRRAQRQPGRSEPAVAGSRQAPRPHGGHRPQRRARRRPSHAR